MAKQKIKPTSKSPKPKAGKLLGNKEAFADVPKWAIAIVLLVTALIYLRAIHNGFIVGWDDAKYIQDNPYIKDLSFHGVKAIFARSYYGMYIPLTLLVYIIQYAYFGFNATSYHAVNVAFHVMNVLLVYVLMERLSGKRFTALMVAALFALHPMHVESVAWISETKDVLYTFFYLLALIVYVKYVKSSHKLGYYLLCFGLFVASMLSKPSAVTLPIVILAIDMYQGRKLQWKSILEKVPFILLAIVFGLMIISTDVNEKLKDITGLYSFFDRIFLFSYAIMFYLVKAIAPIKLSAAYYYPNLTNGVMPWQYYASFPALLAVIWLIIRQRKLRKEIWFGMAFFIITIVLMLQLIPNTVVLANDRYTYVAYIGLFFILGQWVTSLQKRNIRNVMMAVLALYMIAISFQTWDRIAYWKDTETLFTDVINKGNENYHPYWVRGSCRANLDNPKGALQDYDKVVAYNPKNIQMLIDRGGLRYKLLDYSGAKEDYTRAVGMDSTNANAHFGLGIADEALGDLSAAMKDYNKAIRLDATSSEAYNNRGVVKAKNGDLDAALVDINKAIALNSANAKAFADRGNVKAFQKDFKGALDDFSMSIKLNPKDPVIYNNRGSARFNMNDKKGACEDWKKSSDMGYGVAAAALKKFCQ